MPLSLQMGLLNLPTNSQIGVLVITEFIHLKNPEFFFRSISPLNGLASTIAAYSLNTALNMLIAG